MYVESRERIYYSNKQPVPIEQVIESLQGYSEAHKNAAFGSRTSR